MRIRNHGYGPTLAFRGLVLFGVLVLMPTVFMVAAFAQATRPPVSTVTPQLPPANLRPTPIVSAPLRGWVDLHTHPLANLGFGGKFLYGGIDATLQGGSLLPTDPSCNHNVRATSEGQALGPDASTHGGPGVNLNPFNGSVGETNSCGNAIREKVIEAFQQALGGNNPGPNASGYPTFTDWPTWNDLTHQKMWVEWIRRAYEGGLRVMVALAVNNKTLGDVATFGNVSSNPDLPTDDKWAADAQISEIQNFVARHSDFMEVAKSSADLYRIVSANKLAVVIGMEIDHIGNFGQVVYSNGLLTPPKEWQSDWAAAAVPPSDAAVKAEIDRLYNEGVRYIFPIHLLDNAFGGTAAYEEIFNISTLRESGHIWKLTCTNSPADNINWAYNNGNSSTQIVLASVNVAGNQWNIGNLGTVGVTEPPCPATSQGQIPYGQKNALGLSPSGITAIKEMMRLGMLIDIDHMSEASEDQALQLACYGHIVSGASPFVFTLPCPFGFPMNSGHSGLRGANGGITNERSQRPDQYALIGQLHGMAGIGSAKLTADAWLALYNSSMQAMGGDSTYGNPYNPASPVTAGRPISSAVVAGFGTDTDGLEFAMPPRQGTQRTIDGPQYAQYEACLKAATCKSEPIVTRGNNGKPVATTMNSCTTSCLAKYPNAYQTIWAPPPPIVKYGGSSPQSGAFPQSIPQSTEGNKSWNYNTDGVAHYGMLWDFLQDVASLPGGAAMVNNNFMYGADYFYRTWQRAETLSKSAPN